MIQPWERGDEHQRWLGYLDSETGNPADYRTWTLRNLVEARTPSQLSYLESQLSRVRARTLRISGIPATYDLDGLRAVHRHLFQDVYPWAGQTRTVHIRKGNGDTGLFVSPEQIEPGMQKIAQIVAETRNLRDVADAKVPNLLAHVYGSINIVRPFREGNGRTQREFLAALARESGHQINWPRVAAHSSTLNENDVASEAYHRGDRTPMEAMFAKIVTKSDALTAAADDAIALVDHDRARSMLSASYPTSPTRTAPTSAADARTYRPPGAESRRGYSR